MEVLRTIHKKNIVYKINCKILDDSIVQNIIQDCKSKKRIGIDLSLVETIDSELFLDCLNKNKFKLYNLRNEVLVYLSIVLKDGFLKSYLNYKDFSLDKRELFKRRLQVV